MKQAWRKANQTVPRRLAAAKNISRNFPVMPLRSTAKNGQIQNLIWPPMG